MSLTSLILVFVLFGVYGWLCGVEVGISFLRLLPSSTLTKSGLALFTPMWEVTNVFLVFGFTGFAVLFNNALVPVSKAVLSSLVVALVALLIRALLVLILFYGKNKTGLTWQNLLFVLASLAVPLGFGAAGIVLLTGQGFWSSPAGWALFVSLCIGLLAMGAAFVYYVVGRTPHDRIHQVSRWLNLALSVVVLAVLQPILFHFQSHLVSYPLMFLMLLAIVLLAAQLLLWITARDRYAWWVLTVFSFAAPLLLSLANRPYLFFSDFTIEGAYGAAAYGPVAIIGLAVIFPVILIGFGFLTWLLVSPKRG